MRLERKLHYNTRIILAAVYAPRLPHPYTRQATKGDASEWPRVGKRSAAELLVSWWGGGRRVGESGVHESSVSNPNPNPTVFKCSKYVILVEPRREMKVEHSKLKNMERKRVPLTTRGRIADSKSSNLPQTYLPAMTTLNK